MHDGRLRLRSQRLAGEPLATPAAAVRALCAVQAQDFAEAKWALALRTRNATESDVERAFNAGEFIRTHVLRPTWHFVAPEDARWMLELTRPRIEQFAAYYDRRAGLDRRELGGAARIVERALQQGPLTRPELMAALREKSGWRMGHILMHLELRALIVSGPRRGKQLTYALFDQRVRKSRKLARDEALRELAQRYLQTRAPALPRDFAWWSGLAPADVRRALELAGPPPEPQPARRGSVLLLPKFDEFFISYKSGGNAAFENRVVVDGEIADTWRPGVEVRTPGAQAAARRYARFKKL